MKSIKEKAKEVFPEHCNFYTNSCNERKRIGFEAGANYVLDEIEKFAASTWGNSLTFISLKKKIKELKGE